MQRILKLLIPILTVTLLIAACSNSENEKDSEKDSSPTKTEESQNSDAADNSSKGNTADDKKDKETFSIKKLDVPKAPETTAGFVNQKKGPFANKQLSEDKVEKKAIKELNKLEPLPKDATKEQINKYFDYIYSLVAVDFPNPQDIIKKWQFASFGNPDLPDARYHFKENYNIEIILDASGSMAALSKNGKTRMQLAKETINSFLSSVPKEANVSLRVYGHKGSGSEADKKMSCNAIKQVYGFSPYKKKKFQKALNAFEPKGWTPIAAALKQSQKTMKKFNSKKNTNLIYLVSDGIATCGGDPVKVAKSFSKSNAKPIINIIGLQTDAKAQAQLEKMAEVSDGVFTSVSNQEELKEEFKRAKKVLEAWEEWKDQALDDAEYKEVEHYFDMLGLTNEWSVKTDTMFNKLYDMVYLLEEQGIITVDQMDIFHEKIDKSNNAMEQAGKNIEKQLKKVSVKNVKKMKEKIKKKYDKQTQR